MSIKSIKKQQGFTIIEVMIVLAIAAVIMLVVFLAVPALQRNSRNTQRNADASKINAAVIECLANHNNTKASCDSTAEVGIDVSTLSQLKTYSFVDYTAIVAGSYSNSSAVVVIGGKCLADGSGVDTANAGANTSVAVAFAIETGSGNTPRCVGG